MVRNIKFFASNIRSILLKIRTCSAVRQSQAKKNYLTKHVRKKLTNTPIAIESVILYEITLEKVNDKE